MAKRKVRRVSAPPPRADPGGAARSEPPASERPLGGEKRSARAKERTGLGGAYDRLGPTDHGRLQGPEGFRYLLQHYGPVIEDTMRALIARGDYYPLVREDAVSIYADFCQRLHRTNWLHRKPDPRWRFRPYLHQKIKWFLQEMQRSALRAGRGDTREVQPTSLPERVADDPLERAYEEQWLARATEICLGRIERTSPDAAAALRVKRVDPQAGREELARRLGWSLAKFREVYGRALALLRQFLANEMRRLDGLVERPDPEPMPP